MTALMTVLMTLPASRLLLTAAPPVPPPATPAFFPFDGLGDGLGASLGVMLQTFFEAAMTGIYQAGLTLLKGGFTLADQFSAFTVSTTNGPLQVLWPLMVWISGLLALGLFFWQLTITTLRGGQGFVRLVSGPIQYGIALAATVGMVATFLTAVDALTTAILNYGLNAQNFTDAFGHTSLDRTAASIGDAVVLAICALVGFVPGAIGYVLEMLFREAAIFVLVGAIPIVAAGLLANVTASWFWRTVRWLLAAIVMKPVLALALVIGVAVTGGAQGVTQLLAGIGILLISLFCPFVLFRLFAFVDPNTDAGGGFRGALSRVGVSSYGSNNPAFLAAGALNRLAGSGGGGGGEAIEAANTDRMDEATNDMDSGGSGEADASGEDSTSPAGAASGSGSGGDGGGSTGGGSDGRSREAAPPDDGGGDSGSGGDDPDAAGSGPGGGDGPPDPPPPPSGGGGGGSGGGPHGGDSGGGPHSGGGGGGGGGGAAEEAADAAVAM